jgi:hypothetical protein
VLKKQYMEKPLRIAQGNLDMNQSSFRHRVTSYIVARRLSLGLLLAAYGVFYLSAVITGGWTPVDWGKNTFAIAPFAVQALISHNAISPIFFATSLPALLVGAILLCKDSIGGLRSLTSESQYVAILLTIFGFVYVVVGAWPLQNRVDFPWEWQKQIIDYGLFFAWMLYALSLVVLTIGVISLYVHSRDYRRRHPEVMFD